MTAITFRDSLRKLSPRWLQGPVGQSILYSMGLHMDALADACVEAVKLRYPGAAPSEALAYIGRDRRMSRGRIESDAVYESRLRGWLDAHRFRGGPYAMLAQIFAHYSPAAFPVQLVYRSGKRYSMDAQGVVTTDTVPFVVDDMPQKWARFWLFFQWPAPLASDGLWADAGTWGDGGVWDSSLSVLDAEDTRLIPREWSSAHTIGEIVLLAGSRELWDYPAGAWDDPGTWDDFGPAQLAIG
jgi:hypothetical protein